MRHQGDEREASLICRRIGRRAILEVLLACRAPTPEREAVAVSACLSPRRLDSLAAAIVKGWRGASAVALSSSCWHDFEAVRIAVSRAQAGGLK